jgi:hypothetical protein
MVMTNMMKTIAMVITAMEVVMDTDVAIKLEVICVIQKNTINESTLCFSG